MMSTIAQEGDQNVQYIIVSKNNVLNFITIKYSLHWSSKTMRHQE